MFVLSWLWYSPISAYTIIGCQRYKPYYLKVWTALIVNKPAFAWFLAFQKHDPWDFLTMDNLTQNMLHYF